MTISNENYKLYQGDCLSIMDDLINSKVKFDAIITDPPYGTTACKWDTIIPLNEMWLRINKLIKVNGAIVLFGSEPFSSALRMSNIKNYRYNKQPTYNPQGIIKLEKPIIQSNKGKAGKLGHLSSEKKREVYTQEYTNYPKSILRFARPSKPLHPTQKPVALLEYLIRTYTKEGELVLDFTMGSGTTGVACINTNRRFVGIELDETYFKIANERIENAFKNN